jgi:hypothetical protein
MFQRVIHLNSKDASIYRPLLGLYFDPETNLSVKDGKVKASAVDSIVFPKQEKGTKPHLVTLYFNYFAVFQYTITKLGGAVGSQEL